jgi:pyruvate/2-oxoacid:ferredoxin oxidoreductase beta subunit/Pyruvate/2-oxoacid:ferredoxin oxidoreductase gamma subunit
MTSPVTYIDEECLPYFYCPGCGHGRIIDALNAALTKLELDPRKVVIVTDIGCVGLSDKYLVTNTLHGLHGRSWTYATGVKLANPDLKVIVLIGDGGCGIGGAHLLNAARRNIGVTTLVFNNLNYGMTGGEHSVTTPQGGITSTTRYGQLERPLDICGSVAINGASFVARTTTFDKSLADLIAEAIRNEGFSLIDIWELCTAYYVPNNQFSKKALENTLVELNYPSGILKNKPNPEYSRAYREAVADQMGKPLMAPKAIEMNYDHGLADRFSIILAGAAGMKIGSAATIFSQGAVLSGLWATQRNNYPVTVRSGHSISEIVLSPDEILYTGIDKPDLVMVLFPEGLVKVIGHIRNLTPKDRLFIHANLPSVETQAQQIRLDFTDTGSFKRKKEFWMMMALSKMLDEIGIYPLAALKNAIEGHSRFADQNLAALDAGEGIRIYNGKGENQPGGKPSNNS